MTSCIAIFDIGKTNKKFILFDLKLNIVYENQTSFEEVKDEEGENCEDLRQLTNWMKESWQKIQMDMNFDIKALNFTTYGASFVHLDEKNRPVTPLYNYLKAFPKEIESLFYSKYGDKYDLATSTASPSLGMLNSGLQIFWLKHQHPTTFQKVKLSLHFPQYCSFIFCNEFASEFTSIGCHSALWNMEANDYHSWVKNEEIDTLFAPIKKLHLNGHTTFRNKQIPVGTGMHDSSAALIPYFKQITEPFLLLSTGTWCITLNPFAKNLLTREELIKDCLNYLTFEGTQVKASRLFLGSFHEEFTKIFAGHFFKPKDFCKSVVLNLEIIEKVKSMPRILKDKIHPEKYFNPHDLDKFEIYEEAYHRFMLDMVDYQAEYILLAAENQNSPIEKLYVDGGFSKNHLFMELLKSKLPKFHIEAYEIAQGTSLGGAMVMRQYVN